MEFLSAGYAHDACEKKMLARPDHDSYHFFFYKNGQVMFIKRYVYVNYLKKIGPTEYHKKMLDAYKIYNATLLLHTQNK